MWASCSACPSGSLTPRSERADTETDDQQEEPGSSRGLTPRSERADTETAGQQRLGPVHGRASPHDPKERILKRHGSCGARSSGSASPHDPKERILKRVSTYGLARESPASPHDPKERILKPLEFDCQFHGVLASPHDPKERILKLLYEDPVLKEGDRLTPRSERADTETRPPALHGDAGPAASPHDPKERILKHQKGRYYARYVVGPHPTIRKSGY